VEEVRSSVFGVQGRKKAVENSSSSSYPNTEHPGTLWRGMPWRLKPEAAVVVLR
jgi:hypothetical protein